MMEVQYTVWFLVSAWIFAIFPVFADDADILGLCRTSSSGSVFNCSNVSLENIPGEEYLTQATEILDYSFNNIHNLTIFDYPIRGSAIKTVLLQNNKISIIDPLTFKELESVTYLDLSTNVITSDVLGHDPFYPLRDLETIKLERNPLGKLTEDMFTFVSTPVVHTLDLSHCQISTIENDGINLPRLESLDLSWNQLDTIDPDMFTFMYDLKVLDLSHNRLQIWMEPIPLFSSLEELYLDGNVLENIELSKMTEPLRKLSLRNNELMQLSPTSLPLDLDTLTELSLDDNHLHCDCRMKWVANQQIEDRQNKKFYLPCQYPTGLKGKNLMDVPGDQLKCGVPLARILVGVGVGVIGITCLGGIIFAVLLRRKRRRQGRMKRLHLDSGGDYTAVYQRDQDDVRVAMTDKKSLLADGQEFDV